MKPSEHPAIDKVLLLMVSGLSATELQAACIAKLGVTPADVADVIAAARKKITVAADYNRDEQLGTAITRLNDLYTRAMKAGDIKTSLVAQKELNKLLHLYGPAGAGDDEPATPNQDAAAAALELEAIKGHLLPLGLADADYPLREHARIAAEIVRDRTETTKKKR